jgi:hypothetical protein
MLQGTSTHWLGEGQNANGHDGILQDQSGQFPGVDVIEVGTHFLDAPFGNPQDG